MESVKSVDQQPARGADAIGLVELHVRSQMSGRVRDFNLELRDGGLVLSGHAHTYYAKQLAQHAVMERCALPILANEIEVS